MATLKEQKEAFVTGHEGTSPWELLLVCASAALGVWVCQFLKKESKVANIAVEAAVLLFPMVLCQTELLYPYGFTLLRFLLVIGVMLTYKKKFKQEREAGSKKNQSPEYAPETIEASPTRLGFVTSYRATVMYLTFVAILAVDFHVFPRRFAKTEVFGYGLMDLGAGSFVVAAGLVSPRARGTGEILSRKALLRMVPLLALGMIRLLTTKGLEYQEHVSEYGVHWNFFFTLAMLSPLSAILPCRWEAPFLLMAVYQYFLTSDGYQTYIEEAPRSCTEEESQLCDFFAANREGILGVIGYLALFLAAEALGQHCVWKDDGKRLARLLIASVGLWVVHQLLVVKGIPVSRRSTNAAFCVWTLAHNMSILSFLCLASVHNKVPFIFEALNRHGLLVFVVANLLTGLVNLSMNTLAASNKVALIVIFTYVCAVAGFSLIVDYAFSKQRKAKKD